MRINKKSAAAILAFVLSASSIVPCSAYTAVSGDTYWKISQKYNVSLSALLTANKTDGSKTLYVGDNVYIPGVDVHIAVSGDTYWKISQKYNVSLTELLNLNGKTQNSTLNIGDRVSLPVKGQSAVPYVTYSDYYVKSGDTLWSIAEKMGVPYTELCSVNGMNDNTRLVIKQKVKIPVHNVPVTYAPSGYGEYLDWSTQAQYVIPVGAVFKVVDFYTGKTFTAKRTTGANHADCEPYTAADTTAMKSIWGGTFSWSTRPVLIVYNGRTVAASASSLGHAGNDSAQGGIYTTWRSGDYGAGLNFDWVKGNNYDGVFDIHFKNSTTHNTGKVSTSHQSDIKTAAGK